MDFHGSASVRRTLSRTGGLGAALLILATAGTSAASSGIDSPDSGVVSIGRGAAWFVRADDPLAVYHNPAALAFQPSGVHIGAHLLFNTRCFARRGPGNQPISPGDSIPGPGAEGGPEGTVCAEGSAFPPNPQLAVNFRLTNKLALGVAVVAPHSAGKKDWPESVPYTNRFGIETSQPSPQRFLLVGSNSLILNPTVALAYAPTSNFSIGAAFVWGIATAKFATFSEGLSSPGNASPTSDAFSKNGEVRSELSAKDLFMPGFILSALWMPTRNLDVAGWFKWQDALRARGDLRTESLYWANTGKKNEEPCAGQEAGCNITERDDAGDVKLPIPMEAKLGLRYHHPRGDGATVPRWARDPNRKVRDPMSQDVFDVELDFTWANNSAVDFLYLKFEDDIAVRGTPSFVPVNGDRAHHWKDVMGVRLGGDFVVLPNRLALRAGGFFETRMQDPQWVNIDFPGGEKGGVGGGATVRVGPVDISAAFQHTFFGSLDNEGVGWVHGLSGDRTSCPNLPDTGPTCNRTRQAVNGGKLTNSLNEVGLAATLRY